MTQDRLQNVKQEISQETESNIAEEITGKKDRMKNDIWLIGVLLVFALIIGLGYSLLQGKGTKNPVAVVTIDGKEYGRFPLDHDTREHIELSDGSYNILVIENGVADMTEASCPDKICVNHKSISKKNESITCLPNKVIITIENGKESDVDFVAQ